MSDRVPAVSVLLPVYNGVPYLPRSIESVLSQTYGDLELLVWDDASTDGSAELVETFRDRRIRFFQNPTNRGLFPTLNHAFRTSRAAWVRLWAQDDLMKPTCLEVEAAFRARHPDVGMTYCAYDVIDAAGSVTRAAPPDSTPDVVPSDLAAQIMYYHGSITGNIANVTLRRSALEDVGLFREDLRVSGDFELWVRLSARYPIGFVREPLMALRSHAGQFSRWRGNSVTFMREDREIFEALLRRLPPRDVPYARRYARWHRLPLYAHDVARSLLAGDAGSARGAVREIRRSGSVVGAFARWLLTGNQHLYRMAPRVRLPVPAGATVAASAEAASVAPAAPRGCTGA
jgi:glycosyltransferase involved in cell wall biosynthesis